MTSYLGIVRVGFVGLLGLVLHCGTVCSQTLDEIVEPRVVSGEKAVPLSGTAKLEMTGDIASQLVAGVDKFLLRKLAESPQHREQYWKRDFSSPEAYVKSVEPNRARLAKLIGLVDERTKSPRIEVISPVGSTMEFAQNEHVKAYSIRWHVFGQVHGEGILLTPRTKEVVGHIVALPHCDQSPEEIAGLTEKKDNDAWALWLAHQGFEVAIPFLIGRETSARNGRAIMTDREFVYRPSFELGRHPLGYDVGKVLSLLDAWKAKNAAKKIAVGGDGDGGFIALLAGAIDTRVDVTFESRFFGPREATWNEPVDRNLFGFLREFGCAELQSLIVPRSNYLAAAASTDKDVLKFAPGQGGAPYEYLSPTNREVTVEIVRAAELTTNELAHNSFGINGGPEEIGRAIAAALGSKIGEAVKIQPLTKNREFESAAAIKNRQINELIAHNASVLAESPYTRKEFFKSLKTDSLDNFKRTIEPYRKHFEEQTIGKFDDPMLPLNPRTRLAYETDKWKGYEVVLDVFPDVIAYGILIVPNDLKAGEKRPVVVCQHGLEGRPQDLIGKKGFDAYKAFAGRLAERGFITFAPQNLYIFGDRFRTLQRKANPLGKTLFSIIVPQHKRIVKWLGEQSFVDKERIAFYGLSYGGKSAMRIPPLVPEYCLSICSADFNEWVWKNASTRSPYSYVWTNEYEIFEWDLGSTFNYAEMAALIAPRPFMVERGHFDGVAPDETVAYEFAKVKHLYHAQLKLPGDTCEIEFFVGPHTINGKGTFEFLHNHLKWPPPEK